MTKPLMPYGNAGNASLMSKAQADPMKLAELIESLEKKKVGTKRKSTAPSKKA